MDEEKKDFLQEDAEAPDPAYTEDELDALFADEDEPDAYAEPEDELGALFEPDDEQDALFAPEEEPDALMEPEDAVEPFVPTDAYRAKIRRGKRRHTRRRRALWLAMILAGAALLCAGGVYAYKLSTDPAAFFEVQATPTPDPAVLDVKETPAPDATSAPTATPTPDPYTVIYEQADLSMMQNIVNVLIIGVDYAEERETWSGKHDYHADVMMIMAINFDQKRVDLISLPRDTYANIPGVKGIYKLNAALNCGGGYEAAGGAGFLKCCEAASWMIGEIPVDYYYAVTMPAVKQLVDTVGGVDYDLELSFTMVGRHYNRGPQHFDGQGVLDYLRVRKNVQGSGDLNRINRQKQMLVALFKTMQEQNLILKIPDIIKSFSGQLYTNCSLEQTAALALFAYELSSENIGMYSMGGTMKNIFNWNFCLTDQGNRVDIVKTVYGVEVPRYAEYTSTYAQYRWADMVAERYLNTTKGFTSYLSGVSPDSFLTTPDSSIYPQTPGMEQPGMEIIPGIEPPVGDVPGPMPPVVDPYMGAAWGGAPLTATRLSMPRATLSENGDFEDAEGDVTEPFGPQDAMPTDSLGLHQMYYDYFDVRRALDDARETAAKQAERYRNGKSSSLSDSVSELNHYASLLKSYAVELAAASGYSTGKFSWTYRFDKDEDFNEVYVDFR